MKRTLVAVLAAGAIAGAFTVGLYRGIDMGIEEYSRFHPVVIPIPCPTPAVPGFSSRNLEPRQESWP